MRYLIACLIGALSLEGAPYRAEPGYNNSVEELRQTVNFLRRELENQNESLKTLEQKNVTQEDIIDQLTREMEKNQTAQKERLKLNQGDTVSLQQEVKSLSKHKKETDDSLSQLKKKLDSLEKSMKSLDSAVVNLVELAKLNAGIASDGDKTYQVKAGDSLEKIARKHGTTIKALKELNNLNKDQIVIGQTLKLPL